MNNIQFLVLGKCHFCYHCERIFWEKADVSQLKMPQALQKFLLLKHLHFILFWPTPDDFTRQGEKSLTGKG